MTDLNHPVESGRPRIVKEQRTMVWKRGRRVSFLRVECGYFRPAKKEVTA